MRFLKEQRVAAGDAASRRPRPVLRPARWSPTQAYSWEIGRRERVESKAAVDLKAWTRDEIVAEALRAYEDVWRDRELARSDPIGALAEYLEANNYPREVRGTLRDAVSYLVVELLADTSLWRPEQANEVYCARPGRPARGPGDAEGRSSRSTTRRSTR